MRILIALFGLTVLMFWNAASGQDSIITYQGQLQQSGSPFSGTADMEFRLFNQITGGTQIGSTLTFSEVAINDGLFLVELDFGSVFGINERFLETTIDGQILVPRQRIASSPRAVHASLASGVTANAVGTAGIQTGAVTGTKIDSMGASTGQFLRWGGSSWAPATPPSLWTPSGSDIYRNTGNVGINTTNPLAPLHVNGIAYLGATGSLRIGQSPNANAWMIDTNPAHTQMRLSRITEGGGIGTRMIVDELGRMSLGAPASAPAHMLNLFYNSTMSSAHIRLIEQGSDFARLRLANTNANFNSRYWDMAGFIGSGSDQGLDIFNIFNSAGGDILTVRGNRRVGINRSAPAHPFQVGSGTGDGNGAHVTTGGAWTNGSSREFKHEFRAIDADKILDGVLGLELKTWQYIDNPGSWHIGPMAEDFFRLFGLGEDHRYITTVDSNGVALAAIQGMENRMSSTITRLNQEIDNQLATRDAEIAMLRADLERQREETRVLQELVGQLLASNSNMLHEDARAPAHAGQLAQTAR